MVALVSDTPWQHLVCGASVVSDRHVLTAAHCVTAFLDAEGRLQPTLYGRVGSNTWHSGGSVIYFQAASVHPLWDEDSIKFDLAVLRVNQPVPLSDTVAVIGLDLGWVGGREEVSVTGWGVTWPKVTNISVNLAPTPDKLQLLYLRTLFPAECAWLLGSNPVWAAMAPPLDERLEICTFHSVSHGVCNGDSGSGLVSIRTGLLVALVSWGIPCAAGAPDFHTRIFGSRAWLIHELNTK